MEATQRDQLTELEPDWTGTMRWRYVANDGTEHKISRYKDSDTYTVMLRGGGQGHETLESAIEAIEEQAELRARPEREMSSHGTDLEAQGRRRYYRAQQSGSDEAQPEPTTGPGGCPECGGPTSVAGEPCTERCERRQRGY